MHIAKYVYFTEVETCFRIFEHTGKAHGRRGNVFGSWMGAPAPRLRNLASNCESAYVRRMTPTTQDSAVSHTIHPCIQYSSPNIEDAIKKKATSEKFLAKLIGQFKVLHVIIFTHTHTHTHTLPAYNTLHTRTTYPFIHSPSPKTVASESA